MLSGAEHLYDENLLGYIIGNQDNRKSCFYVVAVKKSHLLRIFSNKPCYPQRGEKTAYLAKDVHQAPAITGTEHLRGTFSL